MLLNQNLLNPSSSRVNLPYLPWIVMWEPPGLLLTRCLWLFTFPWHFAVQRCSLSALLPGFVSRPEKLLYWCLCTCSTILMWALLFSSGLWVTGGTTENNIFQDPFALLQSCVKILCYLYLICLLVVWFNAKSMGSHTCTWTEIENVIVLWTPGSDWSFLCRGSSRPEWFQRAASTCRTCICEAATHCNLKIRL